MVPLANKHLLAVVIVGVWALALGVATTSRAQDPAENMRKALNSAPPTSDNPKLIAERRKRIDAAIGELKTLSQFRRTFFLAEWSHYSDPKIVAEGIFGEMKNFRNRIGDSLKDAIAEAAKSQDTDELLAVAILIAELAETEYTIDATKRKRNRGPLALTHDAEMEFARKTEGIVATLAESKEIKVRQAALNALGKITPNPKTAMPIIQANLKSGDLGPQRLAAYALVDLTKKADHHPSAEELLLLKDVVNSAVTGLQVAGEKKPGADAPTRGYCLEAIQEAALVMAGKLGSGTFILKGGDAPRLTKEQAAVLDAFKSANPVLVQALGDSKILVRLAALAALEQISLARSKIATSFEGHDPLESIIERDLEVVARLLQEENPGDTKENKVRFRRGAIAFFEQLGAKAAPAERAITDALRDEDRFVRWAAMRTIRNLPAAKISKKAINSLAYNLLIDIDADLSAAAADAIDVIGQKAREAREAAPVEAVPALAVVILNADTDKGRWDAEIRVKAMNALVSIGGTAAHKALPEVLSALGGADVRVRRAAAETIGQLVRPDRPDDPELVQHLLIGLRRALSDDDHEVRMYASEAILNLAPKRL
jgi:HEAT repeat protein